MAKKKPDDTFAADLAANEAAADAAAADPAPVVDDRTVVYLEGMQDETGAYHPVHVDGYPRSFYVQHGGRQYYHCGTAPEGTWIYRQER